VRHQPSSNILMKMLDRLIVRCGKREKESYELIAEHRGMKLSHWARMILRDEARRYAQAHSLAVSFVGDNEEPACRSEYPLPE
jgi:hypothetical protein